MEQELDLFQLVLDVDAELVEAGVAPSHRPLKNYLVLSQRLKPGSSSLLESDPLFKAINDIYSQLYRSKDLSLPPIHVGVFMFRDIFFSLRIPLMYGSNIVLDPINLLVDAEQVQRQWIFNTKFEGLTFFDQVIDLLDFSYGLDDLRNSTAVPRKTIDLWYLAKFQLEAASAILLGSLDRYAVIQNSCLAIELLLKGMLLAQGVSEEELKKKYGHKLEKMLSKAQGSAPNLDLERISLVMDGLPHFVQSRYEAPDLSRKEIGQIVMNVQFVAGEVLRQFSTRNFRLAISAGVDDSWDVSSRTYPLQSE